MTAAQRQRRFAIFALVLLTISWGSTFTVTTSICAAFDEIRAAAIDPSLWQRTADGGIRFATSADSTPLLYSALRFGGAALLLALAVRRRLYRISAATLRLGALLGLTAGLGMVLQTYGLQRTSPAVSAFLTALNVPFTGLFVWLVWRQRPPWWLAIGMLLAFIGVGLISLRPGEDAAPQVVGEIPYLGETLTILCAALFAIHTIQTDRFTRREDPMSLMVVMLAVMALGALLPVPFMAGSAPWGTTGFWGEVVAHDWLWLEILYLIAVPTLMGFGIMLYYQRVIDPNQASLIYAMEPVHATWIAVGAGREAITVLKIVGGALIVGGNILAEQRSDPTTTGDPLDSDGSPDDNEAALASDATGDPSAGPSPLGAAGGLPPGSARLPVVPRDSHDA